MSLAVDFAAPYYAGASRSSQVPGKFDCAIGGRGFMIDTARMSEFRRQSVPLLREQADTTDAFGEQTLSPEELWRRSQDDWSHGAGQVFLDRDDSDNRRFRASKGVDVWDRWAISLLPDTVQKRASANANVELVPVGEYLYAIDGSSILRTQDMTAWTAITGGPATAPTHICTDGYSVWTSHGADGVYVTTRGAATTASYVTGDVDFVHFDKGRLMAADGPRLYNLTLSGPKPAVLFEKVNTDWTWVGFAEGQNAIYAAGYSGDKSMIYQIALKADATGLDAPVVAGELPDGEVVRSIGGYLGFILLGTDLGVRFCATDGEGNLQVGSLIRTDQPVRCFEGQDRFVWFGWSNYDVTSTGLGRLDLSVFIAPLTPAYASDLMVTGQGAVPSLATFNDQRVFAVAGLGFYGTSTSKVASGTLDTGQITYGLPDLKTAVYLDVKVREAVDTNRAYVSVDGGPFVLVGTRSSTTVDPFNVGEKTGETFEIRHELLNADADTTAGPVVTRYTLRAYPRPSQGELFMLPLLLFEKVDTRQGVHYQRPDVEFEFLVDLRESKRLVTLQLGSGSHTVMLDDALFQYHSPTEKGEAWNGTALVKAKSPAS